MLKIGSSLIESKTVNIAFRVELIYETNSEVFKENEENLIDWSIKVLLCYMIK